MAAKAPRPCWQLSPPIAPQSNVFCRVKVTVELARPDTKSRVFKFGQVGTGRADAFREAFFLE